MKRGFQPGQKRPVKGQGEAINWLRAHVGYDGEDCLIWPYSRRQNGYGCVGYNGKVHYPHRLMCELVNGPAPTPKHQAAHSCGRGHDCCVHPKHLSWKTNAENQEDRKRHGNGNKVGRIRRKLTPEDVAYIRATVGEKTVFELAEQFGVTSSNVCQIRRGEIWRSAENVLTPDKVRAIRAIGRSKPATEIAAEFGCSDSAVGRVLSGKTYKHVADVSSPPAAKEG